MGPDDVSEFYLLQDDEMDALSTSSQRRAPAKGKADIGGRIRVARILRDAGVTTSGFPERVAGSTNEVWRAGEYIIRVGMTPGAQRLRREARLAQLLPTSLGYPPVIASGVEPFGEWIIVRHLPGIQLSEAWRFMDAPARRQAVHTLALCVKALHEMRPSEQQRSEFSFAAGEGELALPHQLPAARVCEILERARHLAYMDNGLIDDALERTQAVADSLGIHERTGFVHGDLHFENVLAVDGVVTSVIDFEWARMGPPEIDLDILSRFCAFPELHVGGNYKIDKRDFHDVFFWWHQVYPEIFESEMLKERLMLTALAFEVPWLLKFPPTGPLSSLSALHPANQLRLLLDKGTHVERMGWTTEHDKYSDLKFN